MLRGREEGEREGRREREREREGEIPTNTICYTMGYMYMYVPVANKD